MFRVASNSTTTYKPYTKFYAVICGEARLTLALIDLFVLRSDDCFSLTTKSQQGAVRKSEMRSGSCLVTVTTPHKSFDYLEAKP